METMELSKKIARILQTRKGSRPGNYRYGSRIYLLRDQRFTPAVVLMFAKYVKEDVELSDSSIDIKKAKLLQMSGDKFIAKVEVGDTILEIAV